MIATLTGQLTVGPSVVSDPPAFPTGTVDLDLDFPGGPQQYNVDTGAMRPNVNSANALIALPGVGAAGPVTNATLLKLKSITAFQLELTTFNQSGNVVALIPVLGEVLLQFDPAHCLVGLRVQGVGQLEYYAAGAT